MQVDCVFVGPCLLAYRLSALTRPQVEGSTGTGPSTKTAEVTSERIRNILGAGSIPMLEISRPKIDSQSARTGGTVGKAVLESAAA